MSDLTATNCGGGCNSFDGGCNCIWIILILLFCCGGNNGFGCGNNNDCSCIWIILILLCCYGDRDRDRIGCGC